MDDGGQTPLCVENFQSQLDITLIIQQNAGPAAARNTGAAQARGKYLAFTDDDCQLTADWLTKLEARFKASPESAITGKTINTLLDNQCATASQLLIDYLYEYFNADINHAQFFTSNNLALPAYQFFALGGFDTSFSKAAGEDREFCDRWRHHGFQVIFAPEVIMYHAHHLNIYTFWRQHFNYGHAAFRFHQITRWRRGEGMKVEPLTFYLKLLWYPFLHIKGYRKWGVMMLFLLSQIANTLGFFHAKVLL